MATVPYPHIELDSDGVPILAGTVTKVVEIVLDRLAYHWDADEIQRQHPHLTLAQVYAALGYDYEHQPALDQDIESRLRRAQATRENLGESSLRLRLKNLHS